MGGDEDETSSAAERDDDLSPWRPGADVEFEQVGTHAFSVTAEPRPDGSRTGHRESEAARGGSPEALSAESGGDRRQPSIGASGPSSTLIAAALVALLVIGGVVWGAVGSDDPDPATDLAEQDDVDGSGSSGGDDAVPGVELPTPGLAPTVEAAPLAAAIGSACGPARVPERLGTNWVTEVSDARVLEPDAVVGRRAVAVLMRTGVSAEALGTTTLRAFDTASGRPRWSATADPLSGNSRLLGVVDGAVIVAPVVGSLGSDDRVAAFDEMSGELLWSRDFRGRWNAEVHPASDQVFVSLRRPAGSVSGVGEMWVLDARDGDREHIAPGAFIGVAADGRVISLAGEKLLATAPTSRDLIGAIGDREPYALVTDPTTDDLAVATLGADGTTLELSGPAPSGLERRSIPVIDPPRVRRPEVATRVSTLGGSAVVLAGAGEIFGAAIGDEEVDIGWSVVGALLQSSPSERGANLLVASEGGASQKVVDAASGRTIVDLAVRSGTFSTLGLFANGVVVLDSVNGEPVRSVLDLDGVERYTVPGSGPLVANGDGLFDVTQAADVVRVTGYFDPTADPRDDRVCDGPGGGGGGGGTVR